MEATKHETPSIGRIIHFVPPELGKEHCAGIITRVHADGTCDLTVFGAPDEHGRLAVPPTASHAKVPQCPGGRDPRSWHFPERAIEVPLSPANTFRDEQQSRRDGGSAGGAQAPAIDRRAAGATA